MANVITISVDDETINCIEKLKKDNISFNLSSYIRGIIINNLSEKRERTITELRMLKEKEESKIKQIGINIEALDQEMAKIKLHYQERKQLEETQEQKDQAKRNRRATGFQEFAEEWYDLEEHDVEALKLEFSQKQDDLQSFMKDKGIKQKKDGVEA